ncbi:SymE family type I addiction module toxin [Cupriavidus taiwanensis]|uniref:SymE family type I addiction module toxin n=1 Tax=Cupriavidus taiwanensis TaxID=164546 RepID=UPI00253FA343|nr:SymE family type I addiction module toxin [Cupriavidus taiwanensis]MDK3023555.1 SymE family type I addiction module toxin [Cupriavidus taiwanensis]
MAKRSAGAQVRTIKTGRTFYPVAAGSNNRFSELRAIPWIRLRGIWLERAGFSVGQLLKVEVGHKKVVISVE